MTYGFEEEEDEEEGGEEALTLKLSLNRPYMTGLTKLLDIANQWTQ